MLVKGATGGVWEPLQMIPMEYSGIEDKIMENLDSAMDVENVRLHITIASQCCVIYAEKKVIVEAQT